MLTGSNHWRRRLCRGRGPACAAPLLRGRAVRARHWQLDTPDGLLKTVLKHAHRALGKYDLAGTVFNHLMVT